MFKLFNSILIIVIFALAFSESKGTGNSYNGAGHSDSYKDVRIRQFDFAVQCWTFRKFTFFETLEKVEKLGIKYLEAYPGQKLGGEYSDAEFNYDMTEEQIDLVKSKLKAHGLTLISFGVVHFENTEEAAKKVFDFAKKMGIRTIVTEPETDDYSLIDKLVKQYNINVAIHNHPYPSKYSHPETVLKNITGFDKRIGSCGDTGHWMRSGIAPTDALKMLSGRMIEIHLKDLDKFGIKEAKDVPFGKGKAEIRNILAELTLQNFRGFLVIEYENLDESDDPSEPILKGLEYIKTVTYYQGFHELLGFRWGGFRKDGWNHYGPGYFELDPDTGVLLSSGGMGLFWYSAKQFGDFILDLEFKCQSPETNSGVFLRVPEFVTSDDYIYHSFEIQINDGAEPVHRTGSVYDAEPAKFDAFNPSGHWNHYRITFKGNNIKVELNEKLIVDWNAEPRGKIKDFTNKGFVGLQNHDSHAKVSFRNIFIKELD